MPFLCLKALLLSGLIRFWKEKLLGVELDAVKLE
jgi:hypothetical protein